MDTVWSHKIDEILRVGLPLNNIGVYNWALTKRQALNAIEQFLIFQISILGGDVYENIDGVIQSNYDNWYCEPLPEEVESHFVERSLNKAKAYIEEYEAEQLEKIFFVFVPKT